MPGTRITTCALALALLLACCPRLIADVSHVPAAGSAVREQADPEPTVYAETFDERDALPTPWFIPQQMRSAGVTADVVTEMLDPNQPAGKASKRVLVVSNPRGSQWANAMATIDAVRLAGQPFRLSARVRVEGDGVRAQLWCRVDRQSGEPGFFDNSMDHPVTEGEWTAAAIVGETHEDAAQIAFGVLVQGTGKVFVDDVRIEIIEDANAGNDPTTPLFDRGRRNLAALAHLLALVEHFHPSTEAQTTDWLAFTIHAVREIEPASNDDALVRTMLQLLAPIAPGVRVWTGQENGSPDARTPAVNGDPRFVGVLHHGRGSDLSGTITMGVYRSEVVYEPADLPATQRRLPEPSSATTLELVSGGVWARVPHVLVDAGAGTLPRPTAEHADWLASRPVGWRPNVGDRATRLAGVMRAWGLLRHFYPYFDVVHEQTGSDWEDQLGPALRAVAIAETHAEYVAAIERMAHHLHDGHAWVSGGPRGGVESRIAPVEVVWIGGELVAAAPADDGEVLAGDVIEAMNARAVSDLAEKHRARISASTDGFADHRLQTRVLATSEPSVTLTLRTPGGAQREIALDTVPIATWQQSLANPTPRPGHLQEIGPGVMYVDLNRLAWTDLMPHLRALADADGVIFDLRGYPDSAGAQILQHLADEPIKSAYWRIPKQSTPTLAYSEMQDVDWQESRWNLTPAQPRIGRVGEDGKNANVVFITDGQAISYAESCMAIVEAYELGEIVGERTAGTNGNVNSVALPGGVQILFTGMRVVKHDGETVHQGVGVLPTIECVPTIEGIAGGRDELLERAIEVVQRATAPKGAQERTEAETHASP